MYSPIEQFDQIIKIPLIFSNIEISISNVTLSIVFVLIIIIYLFTFHLVKSKLVPLNGQFFFEEFYKFIINIIKDQMGTNNLEILPIITTFFLLI